LGQSGEETEGETGKFWGTPLTGCRAYPGPKKNTGHGETGEISATIVGGPLKTRLSVPQGEGP